MTSTGLQPIARIGFRRIKHTASLNRVTHVTFAGVFQRQDSDDVENCGHVGHRTPEAATGCVQKIDRREVKGRSV